MVARHAAVSVSPRSRRAASEACAWAPVATPARPPTLRSWRPPATPTGTPLQNNLSELWSLLNYLLPDIFSSLADFEAWFDFSGTVASSDGDSADAEAFTAQRARVVEKLHSLLKPFLLRRIKADVEIALPRKQELLLYAPMSKLQRQLNQQLLERTLTVRRGGGGRAGLGRGACLRRGRGRPH